MKAIKDPFSHPVYGEINNTTIIGRNLKESISYQTDCIERSNDREGSPYGMEVEPWSRNRRTLPTPQASQSNFFDNALDFIRPSQRQFRGIARHGTRAVALGIMKPKKFNFGRFIGGLAASFLGGSIISMGQKTANILTNMAWGRGMGMTKFGGAFGDGATAAAGALGGGWGERGGGYYPGGSGSYVSLNQPNQYAMLAPNRGEKGSPAAEIQNSNFNLLNDAATDNMFDHKVSQLIQGHTKTSRAITQLTGARRLPIV